MQGVQKPFLTEKIKLGETPVLLVGNFESDRDYLSLLFSNHLKPLHREVASRTLTIHDNFFNTPFLHHLLRHKANDYSTQELMQILDLHIEEGFDNEKLYGLNLDYSDFDRLHQAGWQPDALVIFIVNDMESPSPKEEYDASLVARMEAICSKEQVYVFNSLFFHTQPFMVLEYACQWMDAEPVEKKKIKPNPFDMPLEEASHLPAISKLRPYDVINKNWSAGIHIHAILWGINLEEIPTCFHRLEDLLLSFPEAIRCDCLCTSQEALQKLLEEVPALVKQRMNLHINLQGENLAHQFNQIISEGNGYFILCDDLHLAYPVCNLAAPLLKHQRDLAFARIVDGEQSIPTSLSDLLTGQFPEHNLAFFKKDWERMNGFDTAFAHADCLWDFSLSCAASGDAGIERIPADLSEAEDALNLSSYPRSWTLAITKKHHAILQSCIDDIVNVLHGEGGQDRKEIQDLQIRLSSLKVMLLHSKDELKSMQHLNRQLQQRVAFMENTWYHKLRTKAGRIKKIFFKKNTPGTGTLKRMLQFIRFAISKAGAGLLRKIVARLFKQLYLFTEPREVDILYRDEVKNEGIYNYHHWILHKLDRQLLEDEYREGYDKLPSHPTISIVMPVYNAPLRLLKEAIESVRNQLYVHWELCIADDCSTDVKVKKLLKSYAAKDAGIRVCFREENGHISEATNSALQMATGSYIVFMDQDDLLSENCLWEIAKAIVQHPQPDLIYSDEDKIDESGFHQSAYFKPDWSPDHLLAKNYIGHVTVLKKSLIDQVGGLRKEFDGSQDYDLLLRATEQANRIVHIPKVLYHWRIHGQSAAWSEEAKPYAYIAAKKALEEALVRRGLSGKVHYLSGLRGYRIDYHVPAPKKITIIIPTKDQTSLLRNAVDSIFKLTDYPDFEILVLNNNSTTIELQEFLAEYTQRYPTQFRSIEAHFPFNFSKLMNLGVRESRSEYILLLNNDVEVTRPDWLRIMASFASQKHIGAVGARLLYPDDTIQHAGVIVGLGGIAGHAFTGQYKDDPGYFNLIQTVNNFSAVTAACLLCRREVYTQVNGMDENFNVEYNDVDYCLKLLEAGYYNVYVPQVELYHYESATRGHPHQSKASYERHLHEMALFKAKWQTYIDRDPYYNPNLHLGVHDFKMNLNA